MILYLLVNTVKFKIEFKRMKTTERLAFYWKLVLVIVTLSGADPYRPSRSLDVNSVITERNKIKFAGIYGITLGIWWFPSILQKNT